MCKRRGSISGLLAYEANTLPFELPRLVRREVWRVCSGAIPLIGKDGDDVINSVTCALTGTESKNIHIVYTGNMA